MIDQLHGHEVAQIPPGEITVGVDVGDDIIRIDGRGFLSTIQLADMFAELSRLVKTCHAQGDAARVFVDNRRILIHSSGAADRIQHDAQKVYRAGDRVAVVVDSTLARMQFRRVLDPSIHSLFLSEDDAWAWLTADRS